MKVRHLEVFHAIMQTGSVTGAAVMLNITQPAISNVLRHAEQQIGFKLFERIAGRLHPTPEAASLFPDVAEIFGKIDTLNRTVASVRDGRSGKLAIAASPTFVNAYLPLAMARLYKVTPEARVIIGALPSVRAIEERVVQREVDVGIVYLAANDPWVVAEELATSTVVCALPRNSPLAERSVILPDDLARLRIVAPGSPTRIRSAVEAKYRALGLPMPEVAIEANSSQAVCLLVAQGFEAGLVDVATVLQYQLSDIVFRRFEPQVELVMGLIYPRDRPKSRLAVQFAEELRKVTIEGANAVKNLALRQ